MEIKTLKCVDSKGRTKYIVEPLALNPQWMKEHGITLIEKPEKVSTLVQVPIPVPDEQLPVWVEEDNEIDPFKEAIEEPKKIKIKTKKN